MVGIVGGYIVGVAIFGVSRGSYFQGMYDAMEWHDVSMGIWKSFVFAILMVWIATAKGYYLHLEKAGGFGAEGVSRATTSAVVLSSVAVLVWDYLISALMIMTESVKAGHRTRRCGKKLRAPDGCSTA